MNIFKKLFSKLSRQRQVQPCDHVFFPYYDETVNRRYPIGQRCALCHKFNSNEELGISFDHIDIEKKHRPENVTCVHGNINGVPACPPGENCYSSKKRK